MTHASIPALFLTLTLAGAPLAGTLRAAGAARQAPATATSFEIASVKPNKAVGGRSWRALPGGRFTATNMPLRALIRMAYGFDTLVRPNEQIVGGPGWIDSDRFDIDAKAASELAVDGRGVSKEALAMLRSLLEERFNLKAHTEHREMGIYALVLARKDGRLGSQMAASTTDCQAAGVKCGFSSQGAGRLVGRAVGIPEIVAFLTLSPAVGRIVRDNTGLTGKFDFRLEYVPPLVAGPGGLTGNPEVDSGPTLMTALQEQLGLKLDAQKGPVDVLVIDHIDPLTPDR